LKRHRVEVRRDDIVYGALARMLPVKVGDQFLLEHTGAPVLRVRFFECTVLTFALFLCGLDWCDRPELNNPQIIQAAQAFEVDSDSAMLNNTTSLEGKSMFHDDPNASWLHA
jgi:hypothetical protein